MIFYENMLTTKYHQVLPILIHEYKSKNGGERRKMNLKLLAGLAIIAVLMGVGSQTLVHSVFADSNQNRADAKAVGQAAGEQQAFIQEQMQIKAHSNAQIRN